MKHAGTFLPLTFSPSTFFAEIMSIVASIAASHSQTRLFGASASTTAPDYASVEARLVQNLLRNEAKSLRELGYTKARYMTNDACEHLLVWPMAGDSSHPRDCYVLAIHPMPNCVRCQFRGPSPTSRRSELTLFTRNVDEPTLSRWVGTFAEWALTTRTTR